MIISKLCIQNFRNIESLTITPDPGINIIYGPNGSGKTSLLEAISYMSLGRSFRTSNVHHLIKDQADSFVLATTVKRDEPDEASDHLAISRSRGRGSALTIKINHQSVHTLMDLVDRICVQIIHPQGTELISGAPDERRSYLDWGIYYAVPEFKQLWMNYKKLLSQRNALLKRGARNAEIAVWDDMLADLAEKISALRQDYLEALTPRLKEITAKFLPGHTLEFTLAKGWTDGLNLRDLLRLNLEKDRVLGYTFYGCHRADLKIKANQYPASDMLSRGQIKLLTCAMRLAQGNVLSMQTGKKCVYLIDDIQSELDKSSHGFLLEEILNNHNQLFITNISKEIDLPVSRKAFLIDIANQRAS